MTTAIEHGTWTAADNTIYQAWVQAQYDALVGCGLVQTADTGQLAVSPVVATYPGSNVYSGYWIFRFDDPMQASAPIYIKVETGRTNSTTYPRIQYTVGTGTDGAGGITGIVRSAITNSSTGWSASQTNPTQFQACYHEATGSFWFAGGVANNSGTFIHISRTLDSSGVPDARGWQVTTALAGSSEQHVFLDVAANVVRTPGGLFNMPAVLNTVYGLGNEGQFPIYPCTIWVDNEEVQFGGIYGCAKADVPHGSNWTIGQFGTDINYQGVGGPSLPPYAFDQAGQNAAGVMLVWE